LPQCVDGKYTPYKNKCVDSGGCDYKCDKESPCGAECSSDDDCDKVNKLCQGNIAHIGTCDNECKCIYTEKEDGDCGASGKICENGACVSIVECNDNDGDGYGVCPDCGTENECSYDGDDCDDNPAVCGEDCHPGKSEICDGLDNNCVGGIDEGCACIPGNTQDCSKQDGICAGSVEICIAPGTWPSCDYTTYSAYDSNYEATESTCDNIDNDCDGSVDNGLTAPSQTCYNGLGECRRSGTEYKSCNGASGWSSGYSGCTAVAAPSSIEICDGLNNDCDGETDEGVDCGTTSCTYPHTTGSCPNPCGVSDCETCTPTCSCEDDWYDADNNLAANGCELYCTNPCGPSSFPGYCEHPTKGTCFGGGACC